jgi:hypothetical protein
MRFAAMLLALSIASPVIACEAPKSKDAESAESIDARTVFNRITPESMDIDVAAKTAYGCRYIFADVFGGLERAKPIAGGLPDTPMGSDGKPKAGKVVVAYIITREGLAADPVVIESSDPQLTSVALTAMQAWRFQPAVFNGRVVASLAAQEFPFGPSQP